MELSYGIQYRCTKRNSQPGTWYFNNLLVFTYGTGGFKQNASYCVGHECRVQQLLDCHVFGIILVSMNSGRGWHGRLFFFVQDLGLTLQWRKRVPTDRRPSKRSRMVRRFRRKKPLFFFRFFSFWTIRFQVPQGMRTFFRANIRRIDCVRSYIQVKYLRPKSILDWNEVNYKATRQVVVSAKKSRMLTPFF